MKLLDLVIPTHIKQEAKQGIVFPTSQSNKSKAQNCFKGVILFLLLLLIPPNSHDKLPSCFLSRGKSVDTLSSSPQPHDEMKGAVINFRYGQKHRVD